MILVKLTAVFIVLMAHGCVGPGDNYELPVADYDLFVTEVQPLLAEECSRCHGPNRNRSLSMYAVGEARKESDVLEDAPLTEEELDFNYWRLMGLIDGIDKAEDCPLLLMPLPVEAGGAPHRDIREFEDQNAPGYQLMKRWIETAL